MNDLTELSKSTKKKAEPYNPIPKKCMYMGCPMKPSYKDGDGYKCGFHDSPSFHKEVTESIISFMLLIKAYGSMLKWEGKDWDIQKNWLKTNPYYQWDHITPSEYLQGYFTWLSKKVANDATDIINKSLQQSSS